MKPFYWHFLLTMIWWFRWCWSIWFNRTTICTWTQVGQLEYLKMKNIIKYCSYHCARCTDSCMMCHVCVTCFKTMCVVLIFDSTCFLWSFVVKNSCIWTQCSLDTIWRLMFGTIQSGRVIYVQFSLLQFPIYQVNFIVCRKPELR